MNAGLPRPETKNRHLLLEQHLERGARAFEQVVAAGPRLVRVGVGDAVLVLEVLDERAVLVRDHLLEVLEVALDERRRHEQVDAERLVSDLVADPADVGAQLIGREAGGAEDADASGVADGGDHVLGVRERDDGNLAAVLLAQSRKQGVTHRGSPLGQGESRRNRRGWGGVRLIPSLARCTIPSTRHGRSGPAGQERSDDGRATTTLRQRLRHRPARRRRALGALHGRRGRLRLHQRRRGDAGDQLAHRGRAVRGRPLAAAYRRAARRRAALVARRLAAGAPSPRRRGRPGAALAAAQRRRRGGAAHRYPRRRHGLRMVARRPDDLLPQRRRPLGRRG